MTNKVRGLLIDKPFKEWEWEPNMRFGPYYMGQKLEPYLVYSDEEFRKVNIEPNGELIASSIEGIGLHEYHGVVSAVSCSKECWIHGCNLIGMKIDEIYRTLNLKEPILCEIIEEIYELYYLDYGLSMTADITTARYVDQVRIDIDGSMSKEDKEYHRNYLLKHKISPEN